ncbi:putative MAPEG superfamily protein [Natronospira proteinivora]|uniref:MAPEG superfamily protein n=1 Tax=Natronospira proteinivora TaxID=1807133 RepID=A0ABT1GA06_9GAMM|nr:MAPEG family protein [Natronospira proteinivora]MCP1726772.1 putative MAPEG superfamily protein [Natronospira proteinivora]
MAAEIWALVFMCLFVALAWFPASVAKKQAYGLRWLASNRESEGLPPLPEWGQRAMRAHDNLRDNFPAWAALVLLIIVMDWSSATSAWAATLFPIARVGHMVSYIGGWFMPRFICYTVGLICTLVLAGVAICGLLA